MIIPFGEETRILGNTGRWQLEKPKSVNGQTEWTPFKSFSDIRQAVSEAIRREIRLHPNGELTDPTIAADQIAASCPRNTSDDAAGFVALKFQSRAVVSALPVTSQ